MAEDSERAKKVQEWMQAQKQQLEEEKREAEKVKEELGADELDRKPGESTGEWLARRDEILEARKKGS